MNIQYRKDNLKSILSWDLDKKIEHSKKRIKEFYESQNGNIFVGFSGGKDSTVLLHLVRSIYPNIQGVFSNTTNEYMEILQFVRATNNIITVNPKMNFEQTVEKYGFPLVSKKVSRAITDLRENKPQTKNVRNLYLTGLNQKGIKCPTYKLAKKWYPLWKEAQFNITNKCCDILKKEPMERFKKESGLSPIIGTTISEGGYRLQSWLSNGCNIIDSSNKDTSRPISIWTNDDIWEYIKRYDIKYCSIYNDTDIVQGESRTGCIGCAFGSHLEVSNLFEMNRFERLKLRKPKQYQKIMNLKNNGVTYSEALNFIGVSF